MSSHQSSRPRAIQTPSLARDSYGNDAERDPRSISEESELSHYLHYEDNDGFFPPAWLGKAPPTQHGVGTKGWGSASKSHYVRRIHSSFMGLEIPRIQVAAGKAGAETRMTTIAISRGNQRGACWNKDYSVLSF
ncbi:uncharacterized protein BO96DRAFT_468829 [Aspergillus niger CBS 101883]|uniref:Contig An04c0030, genomic contig n=2 Tax=Aspergillus niger TaxID=5061 RepID=A2QHP1_ASPNC|nr:uncharacterized protein BO96DRAFT_468829 [Aspergillus niger CBS 101883]XP_059600436.1 uncharacterized protein An04g00550 [Aspergillus niger]PYH53130.1 hypothetical protein BO96DRAFT_468829 [Aspergillus niger CBS 101883]CAK38511.1 unnamed protein product [Aspergillus niger]